MHFRSIREPRVHAFSDALRIAAVGAAMVSFTAFSSADAYATGSPVSKTPFTAICRTNDLVLTPAQTTATESQIQSDLSSLPAYATDYRVTSGLQQLDSNPAAAVKLFYQAYLYDDVQYWHGKSFDNAPSLMAQAINGTITLIPQSEKAQTCSDLAGSQSSFHSPNPDAAGHGIGFFGYAEKYLEGAVGIAVISVVLSGALYGLYRTRKGAHRMLRGLRFRPYDGKDGWQGVGYYEYRGEYERFKSFKFETEADLTNQVTQCNTPKTAKQMAKATRQMKRQLKNR